MKAGRKISMEKAENFLSLLNNEKPNINSKRRFSQGNINPNYNVNNFSHEFKIDKNFVPKNNSNLIFDINEMSYIFQNQDTINNSLLNVLMEESQKKISFIQEQLDTSKIINFNADEEYLSSSNNASQNCCMNFFSPMETRRHVPNSPTFE